ncbi:MAG: AI-2E family transporter [Akkermansia sp.]|nr:AI-2E family transporter [Akkermansia sp.]
MSSEVKSTPTRFQKSVCWMALTGLALVVIVALVIALLFGFGALFVLLEPVLLPVVLAGILAYLLSPCVRLVQRWIKPRLAAVLVVMLGCGVLLTGFGLTIVPPLVEQTGELISKREQIQDSAVETGKYYLENNSLVQKGVDMLYGKVLKDARKAELPQEDYQALSAETTYAGKLTAILEFNSSYLTERLVEWLTAGSRALSGMGMFVIGAIMVPVFLFYFLLESKQIADNWHTILPLQKSAFREELVQTLQEINSYIISFIRGQMLVSVVDAIILAIALKILGLPYAITIAAVAAVLGIIPYIGMISTWIPAMLIAWFTWQDVTHLVIVSAIFACVSQFDGWVLQPKIVGSRVRMHDLTVMFSVLFWSYVIGGVVGALLAVPLTAAIKVIFVRYVWSSHSTPETPQSELPTPPGD